MASVFPIRGRPTSEGISKRISLTSSTYVLWTERKESREIRGFSHSEFAKILLHQTGILEQAKNSKFHGIFEVNSATKMRNSVDEIRMFLGKISISTAINSNCRVISIQIVRNILESRLKVLGLPSRDIHVCA